MSDYAMISSWKLVVVLEELRDLSRFSAELFDAAAGSAEDQGIRRLMRHDARDILRFAEELTDTLSTVDLGETFDVTSGSWPWEPLQTDRSRNPAVLVASCVGCALLAERTLQGALAAGPPPHIERLLAPELVRFRQRRRQLSHWLEQAFDQAQTTMRQQR